MIAAEDPQMRIDRNGTRVAAVEHQTIIIFSGINGPSHQQLFFVGNALNPGSLHFGAGQRRQKEGGENADDRDHHEQFDQGERRRRGRENLNPRRSAVAGGRTQTRHG